MKEIKIRKLEDGRFAAQYLNSGAKGDKLHGFEMYGKSAFEAKINLQATINVYKEAVLSTSLTRYSAGS